MTQRVININLAACRKWAAKIEGIIAMSHTPTYNIEFEARPDQGVIMCYRLSEVFGKEEYITYTHPGVKPYLPYLTGAQQLSWEAAVKAVGWEI